MYVAAGFLLLLSLLTMTGTLLSDILLAWLDPRIRLRVEGKSMTEDAINNRLFNPA